MNQPTPITVAHGDGIGPEIMAVTLDILKEAGASLAIETVEIGEKVYLKGNSAGIEPTTWDSLRKTRVFLKAPITTPQGGGYKSLNVTARKMLGLYANVRPCVAYHPFVSTRHPAMDIVIVRENEEDTYGGIEYRQTHDVYECLKLITRPGCERIVRYAFEYARVNGRKKVTCMTKDNIMKMTDGLFHQVFDQIGSEYPDIQKEHWIIDIGTAKLADTPELFDVIVLPNLYGDILSDVAAEIAGSVGMGGSANIGSGAAMFEAIHGSAPLLAGKNAANPSGLLLAAVMMLVHIGQTDVAERIHNAWLRTLEDGVHTKDMFDEKTSREKVGTREFGQAVIARLGKKPEKFKSVTYQKSESFAELAARVSPRSNEKRELVGVDVFTIFNGKHPKELATQLMAAESNDLKLEMISNRGTAVWPNFIEDTLCVDSYCCRFSLKDETQKPLTHAKVASLLGKLCELGIEFTKTELLYEFNGKPAYSRGQGQ